MLDRIDALQAGLDALVSTSCRRLDQHIPASSLCRVGLRPPRPPKTALQGPRNCALQGPRNALSKAPENSLQVLDRIDALQGGLDALLSLLIDNLLVRIHFIIVMIRWTGLAGAGQDRRVASGAGRARERAPAAG